ncbi:MAG: phosphoribosyltransferase [Nitrosomonas sp.]|uniref:phosphoribosyltransferase n=1 Tax=Nitrosomonas sp. TaxID=42353 RepID=UPI001E013879|nr:phosphoribosyltransferase [Nitrosomonas sp.]MBX9896282.1 phosphoribosyltransferase [Nitrosomonas sp.]
MSIQVAMIIASVLFFIGALSFLFIGLAFRKKAMSEGIRAIAHSEGLSKESFFLKTPQCINDLVNNSPELIAMRPKSDYELTSIESKIGIGKIEHLLSRLMKNENVQPYLFAVNMGGASTAYKLAHKMNLSEKYLVKCDYNISLDKIYCETRKIVRGMIVIIDDLVKTGKTLSKIKKFVQEEYPNLSIYCIALVVTDNKDISEIVDYAPWISKNPDIKLPWNWDGETLEMQDDFTHFMNESSWNQDKAPSIEEAFDDRKMNQLIDKSKHLENKELS